MIRTLPDTDGDAARRYHRDVVPGLLTGPAGRLVAAGLRAGPQLAPLVLDVAGSAWTYRAERGRLTVRPGAAPDAGTAVSLPAPAWGGLRKGWRTVASLVTTGQVSVEHGKLDGLFDWEPVLTALYQQVPVYVLQGTALRDRHGDPVDVRAVWSLDDDDREMTRYLDAAGVMRVRDVFTGDEVAALDAEVDRLVAEAGPADPRAWWFTAPDGTREPCRFVYSTELSPLLARLTGDPRLRRLAALLGPGLRPVPDRMDGVNVVISPRGQAPGVTALPWHRDCDLGGHTIFCPTVLIGVQLTGSDRDSGTVEAVAGTHGYRCHRDVPERLGEVPHVVLSTEPGDVTLHVADVLHATVPPEGAGGRRTVYVPFFPPALLDHIGPREAFTDLLRTTGAEPAHATRATPMDEAPADPSGPERTA